MFCFVSVLSFIFILIFSPAVEFLPFCSPFPSLYCALHSTFHYFSFFRYFLFFLSLFLLFCLPYFISYNINGFSFSIILLPIIPYSLTYLSTFPCFLLVFVYQGTFFYTFYIPLIMISHLLNHSFIPLLVLARSYPSHIFPLIFYTRQFTFLRLLTSTVYSPLSRSLSLTLPPPFLFPIISFIPIKVFSPTLPLLLNSCALFYSFLFPLLYILRVPFLFLPLLISSLLLSFLFSPLLSFPISRHLISPLI